MTFKRTVNWALPTLSFKERTVAYVKILNELQQSKAPVVTAQRMRQPATTCRVINLEDWKEYDMVVPTLVVSTLRDKVRDYVGKCFEIHVSAEMREGKSYKDAEVYEIEQPKAPAQVQGEVKDTATKAVGKR